MMMRAGQVRFAIRGPGAGTIIAESRRADECRCWNQLGERNGRVGGDTRYDDTTGRAMVGRRTDAIASVLWPLGGKLGPGRWR